MRTLWTAVVALVHTVWTAGHILLSAAFGSRNFPRVAQEAPRKWAAALLWAAGVRVEVEGLEHLPPGEPAILVANHESWFDVFAMVAYLPINYRFVGKVELTRIPLFGPAWLACGHIAIDRSDREKAFASLRQAGDALHRDGAVVVMFPEGTRSPDGKLLPFKKGAFVLALQTEVPVVPAGVWGSRDIMPKGSWRIRPGTIHIRIGAPIPVEGRPEGDRDALLMEAREAVERMRQPRVGGTGEGPSL
ncbi:MAG TPA: lysophospholipid acyltransferase family protein [Longimicrobiales bacterium]|nr:lysophospholipid acyltransferase family protein [Longimicrobiales bacterium]